MTSIAPRQPADSASAPLAGAMQLAGGDLSRVDALIIDRVSAEIPLIRDIVQHIVASGGKRLRPLLTLISARACGHSGADARPVGLAAAVEFIHTATLLHDDVVDESALRRGLATANEMFGNKASVLVGDFLLSQAFQLMVADGSLKTLKILSDAAATISQGEVRQLMTEGELETPVSAYLEVISGKTAALFAASAELGAVVTGRESLEAPLRAYGQALGMAFQLVDDALDYAADQAALGKTVGDDFREGKITLPVILAYQAANEDEIAFWQRTLAQREQRTNDFALALAVLNKYGAISATFAHARAYCDLASQALADLPPGDAVNALQEIVDFCAERMY